MIRRIALAAAILLLVVVVWQGPKTLLALEIGSGAVAKLMCSCLYVEGREFDACRQDMLPMLDRIHAESLPEAAGVRASLAGFFERRALHHPGTGCTLE